MTPFANRAYHIDDPLYLWSAKQILVDPFDYYGTIVNKWGVDQPLNEVMVVPPGHPYLIAAVVAMFGWGEIPIHLAIALFASASAVGTYLLACRLCSRPNLATALTVSTPAFVISGVTAMTDIPMVAFFVWGVWLWLVGIENGKQRYLVAASVCMSLSLLFKYNGFTAVPLLAAYSILATRRAGWWLVYLLIPVGVLAGYQWIEYVLYGRAQLGYSFEYVQSDFAAQLVPDWLRPGIAVVFVGGCMASMALLAPFLFSWRRLLDALVVGVGVALACHAYSDVALYTTRTSESVTWALSVQAAIFFVLGAMLLVLVVGDLWRCRNRDSVLLFLWVFGTLAFVVQINWSINGRSLLPMLAPLGILVVRRLEARGALLPVPLRRSAPYASVGLGLLLSMTLAWSDSLQANIARDAAESFVKESENYPYHYFFESHWGFQYYMEEAGVPYFDDSQMQLHDRIVAPLWGSANPNYNPDLARRVPELEIKRPALRWVTTMHPALCAGFYAHTRGPLPFAFGPVPPEEFAVYQVEYYNRRNAGGARR